MVFTTQCPQCGKILWFASNLTGQVTICPACGAVMRLTPPAAAAGDAPPEPVGPESIQLLPPVSDEQVPAAVEESSLTHQAAQAVGEVHVDVEETDLVSWTVSPEQASASSSTAPPVWSPPPLAGLAEAQQPTSDGSSWLPPPTTSLARRPMAFLPAEGEQERASRQREIFTWAAGAVAVVVLIMGILWFLRQTPQTTSWEQSHLDEVLALKQEAEQLALSGNDRQAYDKYQELERLVAGQNIQDPDLRAELAKSWERRDALYNSITARGVSPAPPKPPPATLPSSSARPLPREEATPPPPVRPPVAIVPRKPVKIAAPLLPRHPPVQPDIPPVIGITDAQIGASITKGIDFLLTQFNGPELSVNYDHYDGLDTLAVYALMQADLAAHDRRLDIHGPFMSSAIDAMKKFPMTAGYVTYARSLRSTALALNDRAEDHATLRQDVNWLLHSQEGGAFTYNNEFPRGSDFAFWDNSNSQYGLLGIWSGAEAGIQIPVDFWRDVRNHWTRCQRPDGEWTYRADDSDPSRSMTLAGIASLFVAQDYLDAADYGDQIGRPPFSPALSRAMKWLEDGDNSVLEVPPSGDSFGYYALYGLERTGLASGFKYYGTHNWYRERATDLVAVQGADGSWGGASDPSEAVIDTAYALLFLARGRHPILMNKLRFDGDWANRPRDVANLARFASTELERPLNWQVVPLDRDWLDWTDSPILYMASDKAPVLTDEDRGKILQYIENGGMLLTQADGDRPQFTHFVEELGNQLFPQYPWKDLPADSVIFSVSFHIPIAARPKIRVITNGSRILMMHWPSDLSRFWQLREDRIGRPEFELGVNLALYAAGKSELKNRLTSGFLAMPTGPPAASIQLARLRYDGNWDPEPQAWPRAARWFRQQTSLDISERSLPLEELAALHPPIAHLTGTTKVYFTNAQIASVQRYVENGGTLLIDPCGLPDEFLQSVHDDLLVRAFPNAGLEPLGDSSPLMTASGNGMSDVSHPLLRQFARSYYDTVDPRPTMLKAGAGRVIVLPFDLTSGLLGVDAWGIAGYQPDYSLQLMKNIVLWTWDGARD